MKKIFTTVLACMMAMGLFAQKDIIQNFVKEGTDKAAFVQQMNDHFQKYGLDKEQQVKMDALLEKKAENYQVIRGLKGNADLFNSKMNSQHQHMVQSLRFIMTPQQYRKYMMDARVEYAEEWGKQSKK